MISVPSALMETDMAGKGQGPNRSSPKSSEVELTIERHALKLLYGLVVLLAGGLLSLIGWNVNSHLDEFKEVKREVREVNKSLVEVQTTMKMLVSGVYKSQAKDAGFAETDLQVIQAKLDTNATYEASIPKAKPGLSIKIKNLRFNSNTQTLSFLIDASAPGFTAENNYVQTQVRAGQAINLTQPVFGKQFPAIFLQLLDVPTPDKAILAIGSRTGQSNKTTS